MSRTATYCHVEITTDLTEEPVCLGDLKAHARVDDDLENRLLATYLSAARRYAEKYTRRSLGQRTYRLHLSDFPAQSDPILMPRPPLVSSAGPINYTDSNGDAQTLDLDTDYQVDLQSFFGQLVPVVNTVWPATNEAIGAVQIDYIAGWTSLTIPEELRLAILMIATDWFDKRVSLVPQNLAGINIGALDLLGIWRAPYFA